MKKLVTIVIAVLVVAGAATMAFASEDFGPGENPNLQGARSTVPESYVPAPSAPVLSVEEYQALNDEMGQLTESGRRIPAYGSADVIVSTLPESDFEVNVAAAATPENAVPITEAPANAAGDAAGTTAHPNPQTGSADMFAPIMTAIISLAAAPITAKYKK